MSVKERLLTIRLIEKVNANPTYAKSLGIVIKKDTAKSDWQSSSDSADKKL
ncbi:MAG: hypothetical protein UD936_03870 [Acutalibacteraceae bacterium]|nr:hypothetical protein [Acutalibacteraceae bacterium]